MQTRQERITPTISTGAYTSGDQLGGIQTLAKATADAEDHAVRLNSLSIIDKDSEGPDLQLLFFSELPTVASVDNGALNITDAELATKLLGVVTIASSDYETVGGCKVCSLSSLNLDLISTDLDAQGKHTGKIYVVAVVEATPTYASASDLVFVYNLED